MSVKELQACFEQWINSEKNILKKIVKKVVYRCIFPVLNNINSNIMQELQNHKLEQEEEYREIIKKIEALSMQIEGRNSKGEDHYYCIDYFDFENHFRGPEKLIRNRQIQYIPFFKNRKNVLDFGCGRGEFLKLLKEEGIGAKGVDMYRDFVDYCKGNQLDVVCEDGLRYLRRIESLDGLFASQVIEHLKIEQIIELCVLAYEKLEEGSYLILESPNPRTLGTFANAFYMDPSHIKPIHPLTIHYILEKTGFRQVEIRYTKESEMDIKIPMLHSNSIENIEEFNNAIKEVSRLLFGSQDYAVIARK